MKKYKLKLTAILILCIILSSGYLPFLSNIINEYYSNSPRNSGIDDEFLYLNDITETSYKFHARGPGYVLVEIEGIDFTNFMLDNEIYEVSYGLNIIPKKFYIYKTYKLEIDPLNLQYFKSITIEPLFICDGEIDVSLYETTEIIFKAGGPISILTRPTFAYNWLYLELQNETGGSTLLKRIQDTENFPEIDPLFYCLFVEHGTYIQYDINLEPGEYRLLLKGDGSLEYKIMVNLDWDRDEINDIDEIQKKFFFNIWEGQQPVIRLMTSFNTKEEDIQELIQVIKKIVES